MQHPYAHIYIYLLNLKVTLRNTKYISSPLYYLNMPSFTLSQEHHNDPTALAFWMANASEVLHFFKQDADIQPFGSDSQELLAEAVQMAFHHLVRCLQGDLQRVMPAFLDSSDMVDDENAPHGRAINMIDYFFVLNTLLVC